MIAVCSLPNMLTMSFGLLIVARTIDLIFHNNNIEKSQVILRPNLFDTVLKFIIKLVPAIKSNNQARHV